MRADSLAANESSVNIETAMEMKPEQKLNAPIRRFFTTQLAQLRLAQKKQAIATKDQRLTQMEEEVACDKDVAFILQEMSLLDKKREGLYQRLTDLGLELSSSGVLQLGCRYGELPKGKKFSKIRSDYRRLVEELDRDRACSCEVGKDLFIQEFEAKLSTLETVKEAKALLDSFRETLEGKI